MNENTSCPVNAVHQPRVNDLLGQALWLRSKGKVRQARSVERHLILQWSHKNGAELVDHIEAHAKNASTCSGCASWLRDYASI